MPFELPALPYAYDALEPYIDEATMKLHHDKHHQTYVTNLNGAVEKHGGAGHEDARRARQEPRCRTEDVRTVVRNNGGGHVNHTMFWEIMKPNGGGEPTGEIGEQIVKDFGSYEEFKKKFNETTAKQFGSGWGWLGVQGRQAGDSEHTEPGQPALAGPLPHPRQRRLGARLLPEVPEQAPRLPRRLVECRKLGRDQQALRHCTGSSSTAK